MTDSLQKKKLIQLNNPIVSNENMKVLYICGNVPEQNWAHR